MGRVFSPKGGCLAPVANATINVPTCFCLCPPKIGGKIHATRFKWLLIRGEYTAPCKTPNAVALLAGTFSFDTLISLNYIDIILKRLVLKDPVRNNWRCHLNRLSRNIGIMACWNNGLHQSRVLWVRLNCPVGKVLFSVPAPGRDFVSTEFEEPSIGTPPFKPK
jgi:hypothetical protein